MEQPISSMIFLWHADIVLLYKVASIFLTVAAKTVTTSNWDKSTLRVIPNLLLGKAEQLDLPDFRGQKRTFFRWINI